MLICLSSGSTVRYRQDVIRALALPEGGTVQFRYEIERWIAPDVVSAMQGNTLKGQEVLICYIDQSNPAATPVIVPCRFARVADFDRHGSTASLQLQVGHYAYAEDVSAFNVKLRKQATTPLPNWKDTALAGAYAAFVTGDLSAKSSIAVGDWERTVKALVAHPEFSSNAGFYTVTALKKLGDPAEIKYGANGYSVKEGAEYDLSIYHFNPTTPTQQTTLRFSASNDSIVLSSGALAPMDSRYDMKHVRFVTANDNSKERRAVLSVFRSIQGQDGSEQLEFDLDFSVSTPWLRLAGTSVLIGLLIAGPQVAAALLNVNLSKRRMIAVVLASVTLSLVAGFAAVFGIKKKV